VEADGKDTELAVDRDRSAADRGGKLKEIAEGEGNILGIESRTETLSVSVNVKPYFGIQCIQPITARIESRKGPIREN